MEERKCLNCGAVIATGGNYCHHCGQATSTERLSTRSFAMNIFSGLTRINKGMIFTCARLLVAPWKVISDYIHGRRVKYTAPVQLLLILTFLLVAIGSIIHEPESSKNELLEIFDISSLSGNIAYTVVKFLTTSTVIQYLVIFLPAIPVLMLINRTRGMAKYNFAEYLMAAIYMSDAILVFQLVLSPFDLLLPISVSILGNIYILVVGSIGVYKSLGHLNLGLKKRIRRVVLFVIGTFVLYIFILVLSIGLLIYLLNLMDKI